jgi:hypothetical protein
VRAAVCPAWTRFGPDSDHGNKKSLQTQAFQNSANGNRTLSPQRADGCRHVTNCGFSPKLCSLASYAACRRVSSMDQIWTTRGALVDPQRLGTSRPARPGVVQARDSTEARCILAQRDRQGYRDSRSRLPREYALEQKYHARGIGRPYASSRTRKRSTTWDGRVARENVIARSFVSLSGRHCSR